MAEFDPNRTSASSDLFLSSGSLNLIGDESLKPPQIAVADAELFQFTYRMKQISCARTNMSASAGESLGNLG